MHTRMQQATSEGLYFSDVFESVASHKEKKPVVPVLGMGSW